MHLLGLLTACLSVQACLGFQIPRFSLRFKASNPPSPARSPMVAKASAAAIAPASRSASQSLISKSFQGFSPISAGVGALALLIVSLFPKFGNLLLDIFLRIIQGNSIANLLIPFAQKLGNNFISRFILRNFVLTKKLVLPNTFIPDDLDDRIVEFFALNGVSSFELIKLLAAVSGPIGKIKGDKKSTSQALKNFQNAFVESSVKPLVQAPQLLPENYHYFGISDSIANLEMFVRHNPFFASCLSSTAENSDIVFTIDPKADKPSWFTRFSALLDPKVARIKAKFDVNLNLISIGEYSGNTLRDIKINSPEADEAASKLLYLMTYTAENIHATTHVIQLGICYCNS